ncbi:MAG: c-type cytochrome [Pirellulaceae bacterium]
MNSDEGGRARGSSRAILGLACSTVLLWGCTRAPEPVYELQAKTKELPDKHQQQIRESLLRLFGTPLHPRFQLPGSAAETAGGVAAEGSESAGEGTESAGSEPALHDAFGRDYLAHGAVVFQERCAGCHGATGDGAGEAAPYLQPKPRDYRSGVFKFTSTPYGLKPNRQDLMRTVRKGAKGTSMPAFALLSDEDVEAVVDYVILLSYRGELEQKVAQIAAIDIEPDADLLLTDFVDTLSLIHDQWQQAVHQIVMPLTPQPPYGDETIAKGREAFITRGCSKCHGEDGKGQTEWLSSEFLAQQAGLPEDKRAQINYDAWGNVAPAADLTAGMLHGGRRKVDIYRRIHNGINGTPMPSFAQALAAEPDTIWHLVHYVTSVVEGRSLPAGSSDPTSASTSTPSASE